MIKETTRNDFRYAKGLGVTGFPTVVVKETEGEDTKLALCLAVISLMTAWPPSLTIG